MSDEIGSRLQQAFRSVPWSAGLVSINLVNWLLIFFKVQAPTVLVGELTSKNPWICLTYPLLTQLAPLFFLLSLFVFYQIASSLESRWGSERFGQVFVTVTLLTALAQWAGLAAMNATLNPKIVLAGLLAPASTLLVIWCALNAEATLLLMFIIPVKAKYVGWVTIGVTFFASPPILGLFLAAVPLGGWIWARKTVHWNPSTAVQKSLSQRWKEKKRSRQKSQFKLIEGNKNPPPSESKSPLKFTPDSPDSLELDRILDKIRFEGMASLTPEEKETLDQQSRRLKES